MDPCGKGKERESDMQTKRLTRRIVLGGLTLLAGALLVIPSTALSKGKPQSFKIKGTIVFTARADTPTTGIFDMIDVGEATYLGAYVNTGWLQFILVDGEPLILAGAGRAVAANGRDYNNWHMEPRTGRVIFDGAEKGRFVGMSGYFDSTILSMTLNPDGSGGVSTYIGIGEVTLPH